MIAGVVSDTHMPRRGRDLPPALLSGLGEVDIIIHAGDISEIWVLDRLAEMAPVIAVAGNVDPPEVAGLLGYSKSIKIGIFTVGLTHGHGTGGKTMERALKSFTGVDCIIFGHSHIPYCRKHGDVLMFNPGSPTDRRRQPRCSYGLITFESQMRGRIVYI